MNASDLSKMLRCPACLRSDFRMQDSKAMCGSCHKELTCDKDTFFFRTAALDARRLVDREPNRARWSVARKAISDYLLKELQGEDRGKAVCDLGIGTGVFTEAVQGFKAMVGVDFLPYRAVQIVADLTEPLPIRDAAFDIVICTETMEHLPNPTLVAKEMHRILKPGGYCLGSIPFLHPVHYEPYDFYRYTRFAIEYIFKHAGFSTIHVEGIGRPADVYKVFQDRFFNAYLLNARFSNHSFANALFRFGARVARKASSLLFATFRGIYARVEPAADSPLAYCFKVTKDGY